MRKILFSGKQLSIFGINHRTVETDEDFCLKMESLQFIPDQPYSKATDGEQPYQTELPRTLNRLVKGTWTLTEDYI